MKWIFGTGLLLAFLMTAKLTNAQFEEIETDFGSTTPTGVVFPSICIGDFSVPKVMYTIETSNTNEVTILSDPPNLVEVGIDDSDGTLYFKFIQETILQPPSEAGVVVRFPSSQLQNINICCEQELQVKDGFTNVEQLKVSSGATAQAIFSVTNRNMDIEVSDSATATVEVSGRSNVDVIGRDSGTFVNIDGDITTILCTDRATCTVAGDISNRRDSSVENFSALETDDCFGIFVEDGSTCEENSPPVIADVNGALVISGVTETCIQGGELDNGGPGRVTISPAPTPEGFTRTPTISPAPSEEPTVSPAPTAPRPTRQTPEPTASSATVRSLFWMNVVVLATSCYYVFAACTW